MANIILLEIYNEYKINNLDINPNNGGIPVIDIKFKVNKEAKNE